MTLNLEVYGGPSVAQANTSLQLPYDYTAHSSGTGTASIGPNVHGYRSLFYFPAGLWLFTTTMRMFSSVDDTELTFAFAPTAVGPDAGSDVMGHMGRPAAGGLDVVSMAGVISVSETTEFAMYYSCNIAEEVWAIGTRYAQIVSLGTWE